MSSSKGTTSVLITTVLKPTAEIDKEKTYVLPDGNIITVAPHIGFLTEREYSFTATVREGDYGEAELHSLNDDTELKSTTEFDKKKTFHLSDVHNATVGSERVSCAEVLFQPSLTGKEASGFHDISSLTKCGVGHLQKIVSQYRAVRWNGHVPRDR